MININSAILTYELTQFLNRIFQLFLKKISILMITTDKISDLEERLTALKQYL